MNTLTTIDSHQALKAGWEGTKKHFWFLLGAIVIFYGVSLLPGVVAMTAGESGNDYSFAAVEVILRGVAWLVQFVMSIGLIKTSLTIIDGGTPTYHELFNEFKKANKWRLFLLASILNGLIVFVGFLLFIIPGIYFSLKYQFFSYRIVDAGDGVLESLRNSGHITQDVKWKLLGFMIILGLINLLGVVLLGIGLLVTIPLSFLATAHVYRQLNGRLMPAVVPAPVASVVTPPAA